MKPIAAFAVVAALALGGCLQPEPQAFRPVAGRAACEGADGYARARGGARTYLWRTDVLNAVQSSLAEPALAARRGALMTAAQAALAQPPHSVTHKTLTPPSGDKHDYASAAGYWWPDPKSPSGLPYIRRDGQSNPDTRSERFDFSRLYAFSEDVSALALAYRFTGEDRYAAKAALMIRAWFLDPATRMNPHLSYAGAVLGRDEGRRAGLIDTIRLVPVVESIGLIGPSNHLTPAEMRGLRAWFRDYRDWLATSEFGKQERAADNNHGVFHDVQVMSFSLFAGDVERAREIARQAAVRRIARQIDSEGFMPNEIARANSLDYSLVGAQALINLATLSECVGVDLWRYRARDGAGLKAAMDRLASYAGRESAWPHRAGKVDPEKFYVALVTAGWAYDEPAYSAKAQAYADGVDDEPLTLVWPVAPPPPGRDASSSRPFAGR